LQFLRALLHKLHTHKNTHLQHNLSWAHQAPWINTNYNIYRWHPENESFEKIGSTNQLTYTDDCLSNGIFYLYYVEGIGKYTVSGLVDPIINYSQINTASPKDNVPPCPPILSVTTNCELIQNELSWINPPECPEDIAGYNIYFAPYSGDTLIFLDSINNPLQQNYNHSNFNTVVGCYQVNASDSIGNVSEFSNMVCIDSDTCSVYRLPNFFSPNQDLHNDYLVPFSDYTSVERVELKIFNRWGRIVFETNDPAINWDGKNMNNNKDCAEGV